MKIYKLIDYLKLIVVKLRRTQKVFLLQEIEHESVNPGERSVSAQERVSQWIQSVLGFLFRCIF